jgi:transcriptional regulator with XRE-family HTH domain
MIDSAGHGLDQRIAARVRDLRARHRLTLDALADRSGVSRSMISLIERGESSATAVLLERLATALNVPLASLFDAPGGNPQPIARRADQIEWRDPASGYLRRNVSPGNFASPIQIVEIEFPPKGRVAFDNSGREARMHQQVWVLEGSIEVSVGDDCHRLGKGDCLAFVLDRPTAFHNRTRRTARYAVVIASDPGMGA